MKYKIKEFAKVSSGSTPARSKYDDFFLNGSVPWVKTMDLNNGVITVTDEKITSLAAKHCKPVKKGTVLVAMYGGFNQIGRTGLLAVEASTNQALSTIEVNEKICLPKYLIQYLNNYVNLWRRFAASSRKDPNITSNDVRDFPVILPPLPEQKAIANLLSTWDKAIEKTERLIQAKEKRFYALLSKLISDNGQLTTRKSDWKKV
ncbi:MAG: restriction endonuclease subunit S, partial [Deltaproteobacteria bacterium]|nr:restriction endonuclease subunit S [Deltaproteobacteria bacterium]